MLTLQLRLGKPSWNRLSQQHTLHSQSTFAIASVYKVHILTDLFSFFADSAKAEV